jgi:glycine hydroxymethyltransferase
MTSRGFKEAEFVRVADFIHRVAQLYQKYAAAGMGKTQAEFKQFLATNEPFRAEIQQLGNEVAAFAEQFDLPGNEIF